MIICILKIIPEIKSVNCFILPLTFTHTSAASVMMENKPKNPNTASLPCLHMTHS